VWAGAFLTTDPHRGGNRALAERLRAHPGKSGFLPGSSCSPVWGQSRVTHPHSATAFSDKDFGICAGPN